MMVDYFAFGEVVNGDGGLRSERAREVLAAAKRDKRFSIVAIQAGDVDGAGASDIIVVDCRNDQVPTRNEVGIKSRERLGLVVPVAAKVAVQARALRRDFPRKVPHLNLVPDSEPASLCLYFEPWSVTLRTWTPQRFLQRVLWWLAGTANGTLHHPDQPVEPAYFVGPPRLVLPAGATDRLAQPGTRLALHLLKSPGRTVFRAEFLPAGELNPVAALAAVFARVPNATHGTVDLSPTTLGALHDQLIARGSQLLEPLREAIRSSVPSAGVQDDPDGKCLLIVSVRMQRSASSPPERTDTFGFIIRERLASVGAKIGALSVAYGRVYATSGVGVASAARDAWRSIEMLPLMVASTLSTADARRYSGISSSAGGAHVLAGVGALGSAMAEIWSRSGWGTWTVIDEDYVEPHNLARHTAKDFHIGFPKVTVVSESMMSTYFPGEYEVAAIQADVANTEDGDVSTCLERADLVVDTTATIGVPRDLALRDSVGRCVSAFLTPSGTDSVMIFEDARREQRLDVLETQYYAAVIASDWGATHLEGNRGRLFPGLGCRDASFVMSAESVCLHAATLARQIRISAGAAAAVIRIFRATDSTGAIASIDIPVTPSLRMTDSGWQVLTHEGVRSRLVELRLERAPKETGGVLLGYIDHKSKTISVASLLSAPPDSDEQATGFGRGIAGLKEQIETVRARTGGIVGYVGEWHSHPPLHSPTPSSDDRFLLNYLATEMSEDGEPALMVIVGAAGELSFSVRDQSSASASQ
jgi:Prokaryotic E2 family A/ThiF family/Prokaryotic homologs of the JAB domain